MKATLKLDTGAMRALFPEGSEAEVQLQQCVIANIAKEQISKATNKQVHEAVRAAAGVSADTIQALAREAHKNWLASVGYHSVTLSADGREAVERAVADKIGRGFGEIVDTSVDKQVTEMLDSVDVQKAIEVRVVRAVNGEIDKRVKAKMQAAMQALAEGD